MSLMVPPHDYSHWQVDVDPADYHAVLAYAAPVVGPAAYTHFFFHVPRGARF